MIPAIKKTQLNPKLKTAYTLNNQRKTVPLCTIHVTDTSVFLSESFVSVSRRRDLNAEHDWQDGKCSLHKLHALYCCLDMLLKLRPP